MKVRDFFNEISEQMVQKGDAVLDYEICLSAYFSIDKDEQVSTVEDTPIIGVACNHGNKDFRFVVRGSDKDAIEQIEDNYKDV